MELTDGIKKTVQFLDVIPDYKGALDGFQGSGNSLLAAAVC